MVIRKLALVVTITMIAAVTLAGCFPLPKKQEAPPPENGGGYVQPAASDDQVSSGSEGNAETEIQMDAALNRKVNIFLSNFAEAFMESFDRQSITREDLARFAVRHNYINNYQRWQPTADQMNVQIKADYIAGTVDKYFGPIGFTHGPVDGYVGYADGFYSIPLADGEAIPFVQIERLFKSPDGTYTAYGQIYGNANYLSVDDPYKPFSAWSSAELDEIERYGKVQATFTEVIEDGKSRFIIQSYSRGK